MTPHSAHVRFWAVVPAAGAGRRMGGPKPALPYGESTMAATVVSTLLAAGVNGVVVVTRNELRERLKLLDDPRVRTALNDAANSEMLDSIRIGLEALEAWPAAGRDAAVVVPADMPMLSAATCAACLAAYRAEPGCIVIAAHAGVRGHPLIFPLALREEVARLSGGLRELARRRPELIRLVACDDPAVTRDVNTPADYARLLHARARN
jgi:molybdenum cofactor cytidylyltransferase